MATKVKYKFAIGYGDIHKYFDIFTRTLNLKPYHLMSALPHDDSIIDVTGQSVSISYITGVSFLKKHITAVPPWPHQYIYSVNELSHATREQVEFYHAFKQHFAAGDYIDVEGHNNYAFILLFEVFKDYETHRNLNLLEKQITALITNYPKTKAYGLSHLSLAMEDRGDHEGIDRIRLALQNPADNSLKLGTRHKKRLSLNATEVDLLNKIWFPDNNFCSIEYCQVQVVKLFLLVVNALEHKYQKEATTSALVFNNLAHNLTLRQLGAGINSYNYKYTVLSVISNIYTLVFKYCENAVREIYGHTRKLSTDIVYQDDEAKAYYKSEIIDKLAALLPIWVSRVEMPDEATEIELYAKNTSRWKNAYQQICHQYSNNAHAFQQQIHSLAKLNAKNPSVELIYFEASKFMAKLDKTASLCLYVYCIFEDLKSATFDHRQLNKTVQKNVFQHADQVQEFEGIINKLIKDRDLPLALQAVGKLHLPKRKKIILDMNAVSEINVRHSDTVDLLNKLLDDEPEPEPPATSAENDSTDEVTIAIAQENLTELATSAYKTEIRLLPVHMQLLELFNKSSCVLPATEVEAFAKANGAFKNQLIDRINELCYELLDDVLIEEEDENFIINENYHHSLLT